MRVGKGRFRIPKAEVDHLLQTPKRVSVVERTLGLSLSAQGVKEKPEPSFLSEPGVAAHGNILNIFDFFVSGASIILSLSLFLFSRRFETPIVAQLIFWSLPLKIVFFAGGAGLLAVGLSPKKYWRMIFHCLLAAGYALYGFILYQSGDIRGALMFGALAFSLLVSCFVAMGGLASFSLYLTLLAVLTPITIILLPRAAFLGQTWMSLITNSRFYLGLWLTSTLIYVIVLWWGYRRNKAVFNVLINIMAASLIVFAVIYANHLFWVKSFFLLTTGLTALFLPFWGLLRFNHAHERRVIFSFFGIILAILTLFIFVVRLMQSNVYEYGRTEIMSKVHYGRLMIESAVETSKTSVESLAQNPLFAAAIASHDEPVQVGMARSVFEGNGVLRRLITLSPSGDLLSAYPYDPSMEGINFAFRDYFAKAVATGKTQVSDVFTSVSQDKKQVVVIAVPVLSQDKRLVGVLAASLNLEALGNKLAEIASDQIEERFVVVSSDGRRVVASDPALVGQEVDKDDPIRRGIAGEQGTNEKGSFDWNPTFAAYEHIDESLNWGIAVEAPLVAMLQTTKVASVAIFMVVSSCVALVAIFFVWHKRSQTVRWLEDTS